MTIQKPIGAAPSKKARNRKGRKPQPVTVSAIPWDTGATGPANRVAMVIEDRPFVDVETGKRTNPNGIKGARRRPWVETYHRQGKLTDAQYGAALALYAAYQGRRDRDPLAAMEDIKARHSGADPQVLAFDLKRTFFDMWARIPKSSQPVIQHVVLDDHPARSIAGCSNTASHDRHIARMVAGLDAIT